MAADDPFKRYEQAGESLLDAARNRLGGLFDRDAGDREQGSEPRSGGARERTEGLLELIRTEIRSQLAGLGLATREEVAGIHSRIDDLESRVAAIESRLAGGGPAGGSGAAGSGDAGGGAEPGGPAS